MTLTLTPSAISSSIAGMPAGVAGTLIITFGSASAFQRRRASATVAAVSSASEAGTSKLTKPSAPSGGRRRAAGRPRRRGCRRGRRLRTAHRSQVRVGGQQAAELRVVVGPRRHGLLEDGRVARDAGQAVVGDQPLELAALEERPADEVEPHRLAEGAELAQGVHDRLLRSRLRGVGPRPFSARIGGPEVSSIIGCAAQGRANCRAGRPSAGSPSVAFPCPDDPGAASGRSARRIRSRPSRDRPCGP